MRPLPAVKAHSTKYCVIKPSRSVRSKVSSQLARIFEVPEEEISRIMPPGDLEISESVGVTLE